MQNRLLMCATYLQEVEEKLAALLASMNSDRSQSSRVTEALSFVQQARRAVSEAQTQINSFQKPMGVD
jgi:hypothetical protein